MRANPPRRVVNLIWKQAFSIQLRRRSAVGALGAVLAAIALLAQIAGPTLHPPLLNASAKGFRRFLRRFRRPCAVPHSGCPWARFFDTGRRSAESRSLVCRMLLLARQRGLCSFPCCDHREGRILERSHRLRGVGGERPDPPFRHLSCPCPALRSLAPSSLDRRVAAPAGLGARR